MNDAPIPEAIELAPGQLRLRWADRDVALTAAALRAACRCAHCRSAALRGQAAPVDDEVSLTHAEPIGVYALHLAFSDGHGRGIFPWALLRELT